MKNLLLILLTTMSFYGIGQDHRMAVAEIDSKEDAQAYADNYAEVSLIFLHDGLDNPTYQEKKDSLEIGDSFKMQFYRVSVVSEEKKSLMHCRYIYINGENMQDGEPQRKQNEIIDELKEGTSFESLHATYSMDGNTNAGNLGYIDPDHMADGFREGLKTHKVGEVFTCDDDSLGWYYVVEITKPNKKVNGHYVLFYPETMEEEAKYVDHEANLVALTSDEEVRAYVESHDDVSFNMMNEVNDLQFFWNIQQNVEMELPVVGNNFDIDGTRFVVLKDTTVRLYTFQYVFIDGEKVSEEERKKRLNDIYERYANGESFESLIDAYGPDNTEYNTIADIEGELLADEVVAQLNMKKPKELFVARLSQSYFTGILLEPVNVAKAYLTISYPIYTPE